jgi:acid phosphatase family membrane protein YuiD
MNFWAIFSNRALIFGLSAWAVAQIIKVPLDYLLNRRWDWALLLRAGGMPSSHSALVTAVAHTIGLLEGFGSPLFALSVAVALVVIYDATGIRRQAGRHAEIINALMRDLLEGHQLRQDRLREVLGHSPLEALVGMVLGLVVAQVVVGLWLGR